MHYIENKKILKAIYIKIFILLVLITFISGIPLKREKVSKFSQNASMTHPKKTFGEEKHGNLNKPLLFHPKNENDIDLKNNNVQVLARKLTTLDILNMKDVQPPDHLEGAPIENDGHLNHEFRKEIIFGHHMEFDEKQDKNPEETLKNIFNLADTNVDGYLSLDELNSWMVSMVSGHLKDTQVDNDEVFKHLDINKNGRITWDEFSIHFLLAKGYSLEKAIQISQGDVYNEAAILPEEKDRLIRYKFRWVEADAISEGGDGGEGEREGGGGGGEREGLDRGELMNFRHPEQSAVMIKKVAMDLLEKFDNDEDGIITEEEFAEPPKFLHAQDYEVDSERVVNERRIEFKNFLDLNRDGRVDIEELKVYVDPRNKNRMRVEAENLVMLADNDGDRRLSLSEVLDNAELILGSKMVDASKNFHDEF